MRHWARAIYTRHFLKVGKRKTSRDRLVFATQCIAKRETGFGPATFSLARKHICFARENVVLANRKRLSTLFSEAKIKERMSSLIWFETNVEMITNARSVNSL